MFRGTSLASVRCPAFEEWMLGWPVSWTELTPLGMDKFQQWQQQHLEFCGGRQKRRAIKELNELALDEMVSINQKLGLYDE